MAVLQVIAAIGIPLILVLLFLDVRSWTRGGVIFSRRHRILRVTSAVILLIILAMMLPGSLINRFHPLTVLTYWSVCIFLALVLIVLAMADMREIGRCWSDEEKKLLRNISPKDEDDGHD